MWWLCFGTAWQTQNLISKSKYYTITKHYDTPSETYYYLTRVVHRNDKGELLSSTMPFSQKEE
ncbi:MAG TPA: hypothetical protein PKA53_06900 [Sphingobacterium sp.]|nr:hypothetical protein [Sphingobacterium sp.]